MKIITVLFALVFTCNLSYSQETLKYDSVIQADGKSIPEIIEASSTWIALNFKSANDVIQKKDKEAGILIGKGNFEFNTAKSYHNCYSGTVNFSLYIQAREGRFKVEIMDFEHIAIENDACSFGYLTTANEIQSSGMGKNAKNEVWSNVKIEVENVAIRIFESLQEATNKEEKNADDW